MAKKCATTIQYLLYEGQTPNFHQRTFFLNPANTHNPHKHQLNQQKSFVFCIEIVYCENIISEASNLSHILS